MKKFIITLKIIAIIMLLTAIFSSCSSESGKRENIKRPSVARVDTTVMIHIDSSRHKVKTIGSNGASYILMVDTMMHVGDMFLLNGTGHRIVKE